MKQDYIYESIYYIDDLIYSLEEDFKKLVVDDGEEHSIIGSCLGNLSRARRDLIDLSNIKKKDKYIIEDSKAKKKFKHISRKFYKEINKLKAMKDEIDSIIDDNL
jgi:hypothetical protein